MVVCSYFLKGNCRYGNRCKDEHVYNNAHHSSVLKKTHTDVDITVLINSVAQDALKSDKGGQWPLSCYGPFQQKPCFPGFDDNCFEEIRLGYYDAQKNGTIEQYTQQLKQILQEAKNKIMALQAPTPETSSIIRDIYYAKSSIPGGQIFTQPAQTGNIFGAATATQPVNNFTFALPENKSIFGNTAPGTSIFSKQAQQGGNIFGSTPQPVQTGALFQPANQTNIFASPAPTNTNVFTNTGSMFGGPATNVFGTTPQSTSIFGNTATTSVSTNIFASPLSAPTQNVFGNAVAPNPFSSPMASSSPSNIFSKPIPQPANTFAPLSSPQNVFTTPSIFSTPVTAQTTTTNVFAKPNPAVPFTPAQNPPFAPFQTPNPFGAPAQTHSANIFKPQKIDDPSIFSKIEELSKEEIEEYEKENFTFGKIPVHAPAIGMC